MKMHIVILLLVIAGCGPKATDMAQFQDKVTTGVNAAKDMGLKSSGYVSAGQSEGFIKNSVGLSGLDARVEYSFDPNEVSPKDLIEIILNQQKIELARLGAAQQDEQSKGNQ